MIHRVAWIRLLIEDSWGGDLVTAAVAHLAAGTPPEALFAASYMNDWTNEHFAGDQPRPRAIAPPTGPGPASRLTRAARQAAVQRRRLTGLSRCSAVPAVRLRRRPLPIQASNTRRSRTGTP
jgi:hypothetical protein